ncbi:MAG TPA: protein kinase [Pirellulaceae bacterium]|jgi:hypothetical protein|nr:protein kinase [Pirellulaceae bacterium]
MNAVAAEDFWSLLRQSRLYTEDVCDALETEFERATGERHPEDLSVLVDWLVEQNALTEYQSLVLKAGRPGPFFYGDYKVYDRVSQGALAGTFRAVHVPTSHLVALQFLRGEALTDAAIWKTVVDRSLKLAAVRHPFVLPFLEPVDLDSFRFLVYEDPGSLTVRDWLKSGPLPPEEVVRVVRDLAMGLEALHEKKTTAADFRPERIFATANGAVRLLVDPSQRRGTFAEMAEASPEDLERRADYLAPEFLLATQRPNPQTDIYALGCLAFEMLTARPPFQGGDVATKLSRHANEKIENLKALGVPEPIMKLVAYMMAKNPDVRFQTATDLKEQADSLLSANLKKPRVAMPPETAAPFEQWVRAKRSRLARAQREKALTSQMAGAAPAGPAPINPVAVTLAPGAAAAAGKPDGAIAGERAPIVIRKNRVSKKLVPGIAAGVCALLFAAGAIYAFLTYGAGEVATNDPVENGPGANGSGANGPPLVATSGTGGTAASPAAGGPGAVASTPMTDDPTALYISPTSGEPWSLDLVPPAAQVFLFLRPSQIVSDPRSAALLENDALGPDVAAGADWIEEATGLSWSEIDRLVVAIFPNGDDYPRVALRVDPSPELTRDDLLARWEMPDITLDDGMGYFERGERMIVIPDDQTRFLVATPDDAKETLTMKGAPPAVRRELENLLATTDGERDFTALFAPNFFFGEGRKLFTGTREKLVAPLANFLGSGIQAGALSLHLDDLFYLEMRLASEAGMDDVEVASGMRDRLIVLPGQVEEHVLLLDPNPYWKKLALRYHLMVAFLSDYTRVGSDRQQATLNAYLPPQAAADLAVGTELVVHAAPGARAVASAAEAPKGPATIEEALEEKITLKFASDQLDFAVANVKTALETKYPAMSPKLNLKIVGKHLEANGITRNQQVRDFDQQDKTVAEVLTAMMQKANPPPVEDLTTPEQKLIWVVANDPDSGEKSILITTRDAAAANGYELPAPFVPKSDAEPPAGTE